MGGIDEVFAQQTGSGANAQMLNYLTDALGSSIRLTDKTGVKVVDYTYDPYGNTTADATVDNPFQYTGRENDNTGLYYYRARYYSPAMQRFISEDPIGLNGGINVYGYVEGNPIKFTDPYGLMGRIPDPRTPKPTIPLPACDDINSNCESCYTCCLNNRPPHLQSACYGSCMATFLDKCGPPPGNSSHGAGGKPNEGKC
jgi:RHS repeat-associated protein